MQEDVHDQERKIVMTFGRVPIRREYAHHPTAGCDASNSFSILDIFYKHTKIHQKFVWHISFIHIAHRFEWKEV